MSSLIEVIGIVAGSLEDRADELNLLDAAAGDGDLGLTVTAAAEAVKALLPELEGKALADVLNACGVAISKEAPSTSGTLLATGLMGAARAASQSSSSGAAEFAELLDASQAAIAKRGKAEPGWKTMLDALVPAAQAAATSGQEGGSLNEALDAAATAADRGALATRSMVPRIGRAGWLAERSAGHEDAGARMVAIILGSASDANR
ncbi:MAG: DAK2 domain-containing protein [Acidimicrobiales bacterium]|jgi:dihydroxyacetone kinase-like protein